MHVSVHAFSALTRMAGRVTGTQRTDPLSPRMMTFNRVLLRLAMPQCDRF